MATRFMRIDLSDEARDFRPIAVEPGVPMLDKSAANAKILFRWLGGMVAEPVWEDESVDFYVRDDHGGRLEEVVCQPATAEDLENMLKDDLATLKDRIEKAKPETPTERAIKKILRRSFQDLTEDPNRTDLDCYFFRYRDVQGRWRLVWCWGYQRVDQEPAPAVICTDPECNLLFVRRPGQSPKCPSCEAALAARPLKKTPWKRTALVGLLLLLLAGGLIFGWFYPKRLIATPESYTGPVGSRVEFKINKKAGWFREEDVTSRTVGVVLDPAVAQFDQAALAATFTGPGETLIRFRMGNLDPVDVDLTATMPENPEKIVIEPKDLVLGIGTTARLEVKGVYEGGFEVDLTDAAQWDPLDDGPVYARDGFLEGLAKGTATVTARYRADSDSEYLHASAEVNVKQIDFRSLELEIDPEQVAVGRTSALRMDVVSEDDKRYSVLDSSLLDTKITPGHVATVEGGRLKGRRVGSGKLLVTFNDSLDSEEEEFTVVPGPGIDKLVVEPEKLNMVVGQIADLSVLSPSSAPIQMSSSDRDVVEVTGANRLIARAKGTSEITVTQAGQESPQPVEVTVAAAKFKSIAIDPPRVVVPVDDTVRTRVMGWIERAEGDRNVEIAPDLVTCEKWPSPRYAGFDARSLELHGVMPTVRSSPQEVAYRFGNHQASAPVEVVVAPFRLALTPAGPVDLPRGQQMRLQGWATYSGGRRVQVLSNRLKFTAAEPVAGLELRGDRVAALKEGAGPLSVHASYFGRNSRPVEFRSVKKDPSVKLRLDVDRTLRLAGEPGVVTLSATGSKGDVELVPDLAQFESDDPTILNVHKKSGVFRTVAVGSAKITGRHDAAVDSASKQLNVYDPANVRLVFDPESIRVAVDEVARLPLYLEVQDGGTPKRAELAGPGVGYAITRPEAIRWTPPILVGVRPARFNEKGAFELSASYYPYLNSIAKARVQVAEVQPEKIRIVPSNPDLAPGQTLALKVEQELPKAANKWKEVRPGAVAWTVVPPKLIWTPATAGLRPTASIPEGAPKEFELTAEYGGKEAVCVIAVKEEGPDPNDEGARVLLVREPEGEYLLVGTRQRYSIEVAKQGVSEPATAIKWPDDFENQYVRWQAPVLTAKKAGYRQWLRAEVGGRTVLFQTTTYQPGQFPSAPPRTDQPIAVLILTDQDQPVRFPVGAEFGNFRVEAKYPDSVTGEVTVTRYVTKKATLSIPLPPQSAPLSASRGRLIGIRPGQTEVYAEFDGVRSDQPLVVEVVGELDFDEIRIAPAELTLRPGEAYALDVIGYKDGQSVGIITGLGEVRLDASDPDVARVDGLLVTGGKEGRASVTAEFRTAHFPRNTGIKITTQQPARVNVVDAIAEGLVIRDADGQLVDPQVVRLRVGEGVQIGTDLTVFRGKMDMSRQCTVTPAIPSVVQYVPETHSLVGRSPGASAVAFTLGDKLTNVMVEVLPASAAVDGDVVVEPAGGVLAPGQALPLRVFVVSRETGERIDRTDSAVLTSFDTAAVTIRGNRACAMAPGTAEITATVQGTQQPGRAHITVNDEQINELIVEPARLDMSTGDLVRLRVFGRAACGTHELFPQPDLKVTPGGATPEAVQIVGSNEVDAVRPTEPGKETFIAVNWRRDQLQQQVPVTVTDHPLADLRIEPASAIIYPGQPLGYQVTAMRGGRRRVLGPEHGVRLFVGDQKVAQVAENALAVRGNNPGRTTVIARVDRQGPGGIEGQQAVANLEVTTDSGPVEAGSLVGGPGGTVEYYGPGTGYWGGPGGRYGGWGGPGGWRGYDPGLYVAPPANVAGLRFSPEVLRLSPDSPPTGVRVIEVLADGSDGRDVTGDENLTVTPRAPEVAAVEKTPTGPVFLANQKGQTQVDASLGGLTAAVPLVVSVGDLPTGLARLVMEPDPLVIWSDEIATFGRVLLDPGGGQPLRPIAYKIKPSAGQNVVESAGDQAIRGLAPGITHVVVSPDDPTGVYGDELSTLAEVQVISAGRLEIDPSAISLQVGQQAPPLAVMTEGQGGLDYQVPAVLESMDEKVLKAPDAQFPDRFVAQAPGGTQIRATYRGKEAFARVTVAGKRFVRVEEKIQPGKNDFSVILEVLAAPSENALEYRAYVAGEPAGDAAWTPAARLEDGSQQVTVQSPRMPYGLPNSLHNLIIEARDPSDQSLHTYPLTYRQSPKIERADSSQPDERSFP